MNATKLLTIAVAALALTAGVAAATGTALANDHQTDAPADEAGEHPADEAGHAQASHADDANETDANETADDVREMPEGDLDDEANETAPAEPAQQNGVTEQSEDRQGPPADMPGPVPDHVTQIHETINDFLSGDSDGPLGHALSDLLGGQQSEQRGNGHAGNANDAAKGPGA